MKYVDELTGGGGGGGGGNDPMDDFFSGSVYGSCVNMGDACNIE